jgi:Ca-activated chloride channel family protein
MPTRANPVTLAIPQQPGEYELRYLDATSPYPTRGRAPISVVDISATLTAPAEVPAGELFEFEWVGPNNGLDFIGLVEAGAAEGMYGSYKYTREGSPLTLRAWPCPRPPRPVIPRSTPSRRGMATNMGARSAPAR